MPRKRRLIVAPRAPLRLAPLPPGWSTLNNDPWRIRRTRPHTWTVLPTGIHPTASRVAFTWDARYSDRRKGWYMSVGKRCNQPLEKRENFGTSVLIPWVVVLSLFFLSFPPSLPPSTLYLSLSLFFLFFFLLFLFFLQGYISPPLFHGKFSTVQRPLSAMNRVRCAQFIKTEAEVEVTLSSIDTVAKD